MIEDIGIDIVENARIEKAVSDSSDFIKNVLTPLEIKEYNSKKGHKQLAYLCGRFSAKEAIMKATHKHETPHFLEIEITTNPDGSPNPHFKNYSLKISISHEKHYTVSEAILLKTA